MNRDKYAVRKPELLAPGGDLSKALTALDFGADAVYVGGEAFGLRSAAGNFTEKDIDAIVEYAHRRGRKVYVTLNVLPRTKELDAMARYAVKLRDQKVDGVIVSDLGAFRVISCHAPQLDIHISTQANTLNLETCRFWAYEGASRINLARELSLEEIEEIHQGLVNDAKASENSRFMDVEAPLPELEVFVHGAMCMAYSGRCMLSDYLAGRSSNRGECAQPCRWEYYFTDNGEGSGPYIISAQIEEEKRRGQKFTVEETERGTFLFNSRDLCLLEYLPELINAGAGALKIEGRMKSEYYVALTVRAYRIALDYVWEELEAGRSGKLPPELLQELMDEVCSVSHREYSSGFLLGGRGEQIYGTSSYIRNSVYAGVVESCEQRSPDNGGGYLVTLSQRGNFGISDELELVQPEGPVLKISPASMTDADGNEIARAPHPCMTVRFAIPFPVKPGSMLRARRRQEG